MIGARFYGKHDIRIEDFEIEELAPDEVMVEVKYCGICGTDVHVYSGGGGSSEINVPVVPGHEFSGTVCGLGKDVSGFAIGDRVVVDPNDMCGYCEFCQSGRSAFCNNHVAICQTVDGGFAEKVKIRQKQVYHIGELSFEEAAMIEPLSCCMNTFEVFNLRVGDIYLVIGAGPIGLMTMQLAKLAGASFIAVAEIQPENQEKAKKLGADLVFNPLEDNLPELLKKAGVTNIDKIVECVGSTKTQSYALQVAGKGCEVMFFGLTNPDAELVLKPFELFRKQISVFSSFINPYTFKPAVDIAVNHKVDLMEIMDRIIPLKDLTAVLADPSLRCKGKVLVDTHVY